MIYKTIFITSLSVLVIQESSGQSFMHGMGATVSVMTANISTPAVRYTATLAVTNLTWFPRLTLAETDRTSISIGIPIGGGIGIASSTSDGESSLYYGFDFPLVADYNIGRKSTHENEDRFGWYLGAGFGYMLTNWTDGYSSEKLNSYGPLIRAGIRFGAGSKNPDKATTVGLYYKHGIESTKFKTFGIAAITEF